MNRGRMRAIGLLAGLSVMVMVSGWAGAPAPQGAIAPDRNQIQGRASHPDDRLAFGNVRPLLSQIGESYDEALRGLFSRKPKNSAFKVKVWTDKDEYKIGETITFFVEADKDSYLTLLDIGPGGDVTVIFPNDCHKDNKIRKGVRYSIPAENYGFEFRVAGPTGLERIKAVATLERKNKKTGGKVGKCSPQGFQTITPGTTQGTQELKKLSRGLFSKTKKSSGWAEATHEVSIRK